MKHNFRYFLDWKFHILPINRNYSILRKIVRHPVIRRKSITRYKLTYCFIKTIKPNVSREARQCIIDRTSEGICFRVNFMTYKAINHFLKNTVWVRWCRKPFYPTICLDLIKPSINEFISKCLACSCHRPSCSCIASLSTENLSGCWSGYIRSLLQPCDHT